MTPNREMAAAYIAALTGSQDSAVTWQLFTDARSGPRYATVYYYPLERLWSELCYQNARGVGVYMMVNEGDGPNRRAENVVGLRAVFIDDDEDILPPGSDRLRRLPPSFSVRSRRGCHHYWLLRPGEPVDAFSSAQVALASHFGTDAAVKDLPRVMRVPGFLHMKDPASPFMVDFVPGSMGRYGVAEVLAAYPASAQPSTATPTCLSVRPSGRRVRPQGSHRSSAETATTLDAFRGLRVVRWAAENPGEVSREAWRGIATNLAAAVLDREELHEQAAALFHSISRCDPERYSERDTDRAFRDALKSARDFGPMTYATLKQAGVPADICDAGAEHAKAPVGVARLLSLLRKPEAPTVRRAESLHG